MHPSDIRHYYSKLKPHKQLITIGLLIALSFLVSIFALISRDVDNNDLPLQRIDQGF